MGIKIITGVCFIFLSYVVLLTILNLNNRVDKLHTDLQLSSVQLRELKKELITSHALIGSVDSEISLPKE